MKVAAVSGNFVLNYFTILLSYPAPAGVYHSNIIGRFLGYIDLFLQFLRQPFIIAIEESDVFTLCSIDACIAGSRAAPVCFVTYGSDTIIVGSTQYLGEVIG